MKINWRRSSAIMIQGRSIILRKWGLWSFRGCQFQLGATTLLCFMICENRYRVIQIYTVISRVSILRGISNRYWRRVNKLFQSLNVFRWNLRLLIKSISSFSFRNRALWISISSFINIKSIDFLWRIIKISINLKCLQVNLFFKT